MTVPQTKTDAPGASLPNPGPLTEEQKKLVKSTAPILQQHGEAITRRFYKQMLEKNPDLKNVFNHSKQQVRASSCRVDPAFLTDSVERRPGAGTGRCGIRLRR